MGVTASFVDEDLYVTPGQVETAEVRLRNNGTVVDQFTLEVLGTAKEWITVTPSLVNVFPQQEASVQLTLAPPRSSEVPAGAVSFGLRVLSREDPAGSVVEESTVEVGAFTEPSLELAPRTARGRTRAKFRLVVTNTGNTPMQAELFALDPDDKLDFKLRQRTVVVDGGTSVIVRLRTRAHKTLVKGPPNTLPFQVMAQEDGGDELTVDGAMTQLALVPKSALKVLAFAVVAIAALVMLYQLVLKPVVKSEAGQAAVERANELASNAEQAQQNAQEAQDTAKKAQEEAAQAASKAEQAAGNAAGADAQGGGQFPALGSANGEDGSPNGNGSSGGPLQAVDFRIQSKVGPNTAFEPFEYAVPDGQTLYVSDIYLGNPFGDAGVVQLRRDEAVLLEVDLRNFRDLDYHFVQPIEFKPGQRVVLAVQCAQPGTTPTGAPAAECSPAGYFSGRAVVK